MEIDVYFKRPYAVVASQSADEVFDKADKCHDKGHWKNPNSLCTSEFGYVFILSCYYTGNDRIDSAHFDTDLHTFDELNVIPVRFKAEYLLRTASTPAELEDMVNMYAAKGYEFLKVFYVPELGFVVMFSCPDIVNVHKVAEYDAELHTAPDNVPDTITINFRNYWRDIYIMCDSLVSFEEDVNYQAGLGHYISIEDINTGKFLARATALSITPVTILKANFNAKHHEHVPFRQLSVGALM